MRTKCFPGKKDIGTWDKPPLTRNILIFDDMNIRIYQECKERIEKLHRGLLFGIMRLASDDKQ